VILTNEERAKFIEYLEKDAESSRLLLEQMGKLPMLPNEFDKKLRVEMMAQLVVAKKLRSLTSETL